MPIRATVSNKATMTVTGLSDDVPANRWTLWLGDVGDIIGERIAKDFDNERGAGKSLVGVTDEHEQRKARDGLDLRLGHMYGDLQAELDQGGLFTVGPVVNGRATITFDEERLYSRLPHARYYVKDMSKVRGGRLLVVLAKDVTVAERYLRARESEWLQGGGTSRRERGPRTPRSGLARVGREAARLVFRVGR